MKLLIVGAQAEGKTQLLNTIRRRVLEDYGAECRINDGASFIQGGLPKIDVLLTNDLQEAKRFLEEEI